MTHSAVQHAPEAPYVYGSPAIAETNAESGIVFHAMLVYWLLFTVSGTPNDGKGPASTSSVLCPR